MDADRRRVVATVLAFVATLVLNSAANVLPLNGQTTAEISDRFRVLVIPAGFTFAIWGLIYLLQVVFVVHQARPSRLRDPLLRRLGWLPAAAGALNATWILAWHWEVYPLTLALMLGLLATLIAIVVRAEAWALTGTDRWAVGVPWVVYLGWITVATILNVAVVGAWAGVPTFGLEPPAIAGVVLAVGAVVAVVALLRTGDPAFGLVIAWAYGGILAKESAAGTPIVPLVAGATIAVVLALVLAAVAGRLPPAPGRTRATVGAG